MKIHVLCNDGSPIGVTLKDLWGEGNRGIGVGGSEYALLTMCEAWHNAGHEVVLYNSPMTENGSPFEQRPIYEYDTNEQRDVLIVFRSPSIRAIVTCNCFKVWWSCDQYTIGNFAEFAPAVNKIVCISDAHKSYFASYYGIINTEVIDLPIRLQDIKDVGEVIKVPNKVIFTSVPDRGLGYLRGMWGHIQARLPEINLTITSDYRLWGVGEENYSHKESWKDIGNVRFLGAIPRKQLLIEQLQSNLLIYPCTYEELFCVSVAEAQCCGVYPITSGVGALVTTNEGTIIPGNPASRGDFSEEFMAEIVNLLSSKELLLLKQQEVMEKSIKRFDPENIMKQWDEKIFA